MEYLRENSITAVSLIAMAFWSRIASQIVLDPARVSKVIYFFVLAYTDYDDKHPGLCSYQLIDDSYPFTAQFDLQKVCEIQPVFMPERFSVSSFTLRQRVFLYLCYGLADKDLL